MPREYSGEVTFIHKNKNDSSHTFSISENLHLCIRLPRRAFVKSLSVSFFDGYSYSKKETLSATWKGNFGSYDEYEICIEAEKIGVGLHFLSIIVDNGVEKLHTSSVNGEKLIFSATDQRDEKLQLSVYDFKYCEPDSFLGGIIYHIFVDRFNRGKNPKCKSGARIVEDWSEGVAEFPEYPGAPMKNNTFFGGTLYGVIDKLDYIKSLGADIIYLSPIFDAASNHKYDTGDYTRVDEMFGGDEALESLIAECKVRNMRVVLDGVFNHTGSDSIYFNKNANYPSVGAYQSKNSEYYDWYTFTEHPDKYTAWWDIEILPRLNLETPSCRDFFVGDGGIIEKYIKLGISGFRLDVADELSDSFIGAIKKKMSNLSRENILFGEVWEDASNKIAYGVRKKYYIGEELDGVMNYPLRTGIIDYVTKKETASLVYALSDILKNAPKRIADTQMNLLGTHDTERILTILGGESAEGKSNAELKNLRMSKEAKVGAAEKLKAIYTVVATLPGIPSIFYGDEAGLEGYGDPFNRMPYPWGVEEKSIIDHYKKVGNIRRANSVYRSGAFKLLHISPDFLVFSRTSSDGCFVTVFNNSSDDLGISFNTGVRELISGDFSAEFTLNGNESAIFKTKNNELKFRRI